MTARFERFQLLPCGTRAKYVQARCRCAACRAANARYYHERQAAAKALAVEIVTPARDAPQRWTHPDGTSRVRLYKRACPGVDGRPCRLGAHLRKDSTGGVCGACRGLLVWNGIVSAAPVLAHLKRLSKQGVGYKSVAASADVSVTVLQRVMVGTKTHMRAQAIKRVLAVTKDALADHALVRAGRTHQQLTRLLEEGFTKTELARRLGSKAKTPALQLRAFRITAKTAMKVDRLYRMVMAEGGEL